MKTYIYYNESGQVQMFSDGKLKEAPQGYIKKTLTDDNFKKLKDNKNKREVKEDKLVINDEIIA